MKKILIALILIVVGLLLAGFWWFKNGGQSQSFSQIKNRQDTSQGGSGPDLTLSFKGQEISISYHLVDPKASITLNSNLEEKLSARKLFEQNNCSFLVNAGFYTKDDRPIGYLKTQEGVIRDRINNAFFNAFIYEEKNQKVRFSKYLGEEINWGLQAGPFLIEDGQSKKLKIKDDKLARRVVAALTNEDELVFMILYDKKTNFSGPY